MFHVEHSPVQEAATELGTALQKLEGIGVEDLQGKQTSCFQPSPLLLPINSQGMAQALGLSDTEGGALCQGGEDNSLFLLPLNQRIDPCRTKGSAKTKQVDGFKNAALAAAIVAVNDVDG